MLDDGLELESENHRSTLRHHIQTIIKQITVGIEGHSRRRMTHLSLHRLHICASIHQQSSRYMPQTMWRHPLYRLILSLRPLQRTIKPRTKPVQLLGARTSRGGIFSAF